VPSEKRIRKDCPKVPQGSALRNLRYELHLCVPTRDLRQPPAVDAHSVGAVAQRRRSLCRRELPRMPGKYRLDRL